jgi:hypothetical protein
VEACKGGGVVFFLTLPAITANCLFELSPEACAAAALAPLQLD